MQNRGISQRLTAMEITEGAGVLVHRSLGSPACRNLDPFLMLDHIGSDDPDDYLAGFPEHPHRGFNTFTYMLDGHMRHSDSMGNTGTLEPGGAQWMKAASGIIHSEMPQQIDGLMRGFQLWINLPAREKMSAPDYQEIRAHAIPEWRDGSAVIRLLAGHYKGQTGPVIDHHTGAQIMDVRLQANARLTLPVDSQHNAFVYVFEGTARLDEHRLETHTLAILGPGDQVQIETEQSGTRLLLVSGKPIGEPIVQYGPFVMNSREEVEQAMTDYRSGKLVQQKAAMTIA